MNQSRPKLLVRLALLAALLGLAGALTFGYLGWLHPAFDSFSHLRLHIAAALALFALPLALLRFWPEAGFALALAATAIVQTTGFPFSRAPAAAQAPTQAAGDGAVYRLLHMNLRYDNATPEAALSLIGQLRPDVLTLNEVSRPWRERLEPLDAAYPYRLICPAPSHVGGVAILSRRPFSDGFEPYCADRGAFGHVKLDMGGRALEVATLHMGWPWPFEQQWRLPLLTPVLAKIGDTAILAGDLNSVPWSRSARRVAEDAGAELLRGIGPTWLDRRLPAALRPLVGFPIDNVMVKGAVAPLDIGSRLEPNGSDHLPVLLEFTLPQRK